MQRDPSNPQSGMNEQNLSRQGGRAGTATEYMSETIQSTSQNVGTALGSIGDQIGDHPIIAGSILVGIASAIFGGRIAQIRAMRRQKSPLERARELIGPIGFVALAALIRRRVSPMRRLRERGRGLAGVTQDIRGSIMESIPSFGAQRGRMRGGQSAIRQAGYALSLVPVTMAFLRNPLVRGIGLRMMSRRMGRR